MLLQTNSYIVPSDKRAEHARLLRRFRQVLARLGCDQFEVYEQVGSNWNAAEISGRVVQIMRFRDRRHQLAVQAAERSDPAAQAVIAEFCNLINFPYQQQQGLFAVGFYNAVLPVSAARGHDAQDAHEAREAKVAAAGAAAAGVAEGVEMGQPAGPVAEPGYGPDAAVDDAAGEEPLAENRPAVEHLSPALHAEEPVFAEGTEGIIAAAEQLSDDELDAGGDAAVASAIAGASSNGEAHHAGAPMTDEAVSTVATDVPPETSARAESDTTEHEGGDEELDLAALLDPYLAPEDNHREPEGNGGGRLEQWSDTLSLEGVLEDRPGHVDLDGRENGATKDVALEPEREHDRNHVSQ